MIISLNLTGKRVVIVGSSKEAFSRALKLSEEGAFVVLLTCGSSLSPEFPIDSIQTFRRSRMRARDFRNAFLVIATDRNVKINERLQRWALKYGFLLNTLDEKESCNFYHVASRRIAPSIEVAVSTNGSSPAFASRLATHLSELVSREDLAVYDAFVSARRQLRAKGMSTFDFDWDVLDRQVRGSKRTGENDTSSRTEMVDIAQLMSKGHI